MCSERQTFAKAKYIQHILYHKQLRDTSFFKSLFSKKIQNNGVEALQMLAQYDKIR